MAWRIPKTRVGGKAGQAASIILSLALSALLPGCAGDPLQFLDEESTETDPVQTEIATAKAAIGTKVQFHHGNFYSLMAPKETTGCAGDARTYFTALDWGSPSGTTLDDLDGDPTEAPPEGYVATTGATGPVPFAQSSIDQSASNKPAFIKNVSVDMTDANAPIATNGAFACSMGNGPGAPPTSNCATFDYGAIGGVPTNLGGTLVILGGLQTENLAGRHSSYTPQSFSIACGPARGSPGAAIDYNSCASDMYALGVDVLPAETAATGDGNPNPLTPGLEGDGAASAPISTWAKLSAGSDYSGPRGAAGAALSYSPGTQTLLLAGGASPLIGMGPTGSGADTVQTWSYDLKAQKWTQVAAIPYAGAAMLGLNDLMPSDDDALDCDLADYGSVGADNTFNDVGTVNKGFGARTLFGYVPLAGFAQALLSASNNSSLDTTERLFAVAGLSGSGVINDTQRFNPTFGPDFVNAGNAAATNGPRLWMDSYHTQLVSNGTRCTRLRPYYQTAYNVLPYGGLPVNMAVAPAYNFAGGTIREGVAVSVGGFHAEIQNTNNIPVGAFGSVTSYTEAGGTFHYTGRRNNDTSAAGKAAVPNLPDGTELRPIQWRYRDEGDLSTDDPGFRRQNVPWYGGATLLPGFDRSQNDLVLFGGSTCQTYLIQGSDPDCLFTNPGRYWRLSGGTPFSGTSTLPTALQPSGPAGGSVNDADLRWGPGVGTTIPPRNAGMAAARGYDGDYDNPIIVAWGGNLGAGVTDTANQVWVLSSNADGDTNAANARWFTRTPTGTPPTGKANATLVFSHVTRKFYLFGGYDSNSATTSGQTWELSVSGDCSAGTCSFAWRQLDVAGGTTCYPSCPSARRSHRMAEVNYHLKQTSPADPTDTADSELKPICAPEAPCSFGIFMEGGTLDGVNAFSDRWMFDPTANQGYGHWQQVNGFPPRHLAAIANAEYYAPSAQQTLHRAVMFGGETGMANPQAFSGNGSFVPPTLGDTYMYDHDTLTWNRVRLLGVGYEGGPPSGLDEWDSRQAYDSSACPGTSPDLCTGSPPPLAGHILVARTFPQAIGSSGAPIDPLKIPQLYLIGGRTKDGGFNTFGSVYKFCPGSTGEMPQNIPNPGDDGDGLCDAYDNSTNPLSVSPSQDYVGRWLIQNPTGGLGSVGSFQGAGTYDPVHDRIIVYGGLTPTGGAPQTVTDSGTFTASSTVYEYQPPSASGYSSGSTSYEGRWTAFGVCAGSDTPTPRYGHSLGYDILNRQLIVTGGYDASTGELLTQTVTQEIGNLSYTTPEVWVGRRDSDNTCYTWTLRTVFGNSAEIESQAPPQTGIAHAASVFLPASGYNLGYYAMLDNSCAKAGPFPSSDPNISKTYAGGAYIDIDRSQLGPNESLLLHLTYIPLGPDNQRPDGQKFSAAESAVINIHLVKTGQSEDSLLQALQPRHIVYADWEQQYPQVVKKLSILAPPTGTARQEQVLIPLGIDPAIDRIRIERVSGSAVLIDATIMRMGLR